jgi:predicted transcriptional regulator
MDKQTLIAVGLSPIQAAAYALLIELGQVKPAVVAQRLKTTRTNAYKVLDKLVELKLVHKLEEGKTFTYAPANPIALTTLTAQYRAEAMAREEAVSKAMHDLLAKYYHHTKKPSVETFTGRQDVARAYRRQLTLREDIHFIHTSADVPMMGFDIMHEIRTTPARHGTQRHSIMTEPPKGPINYHSHKRSNMDVTWARKDQYNSPVEWSVTNSSLLIVSYATEPHAILITDKVIAAAFMQMWHLLSTLLRQQETHQRLSSNGG